MEPSMRLSPLRSPIFVLCAIALLASPSLVAAVAVGDKPELSGKSGTGEKIELSQFAGKIVVVDFWATWCEQCLEEAPHMVELNKKWSSEGLQMLGVSLDSDAPKMIAVVKEKGFDWPHIFGGQVWKSPQSIAWDIEALPTTFVIGPDGSVLWTGRPAEGLDEAIQKAFKEHPPTLVDPKAVAEATATLDRVDSAIAGKDFTGALTLLGKIPAAAAKEKKIAARMARAQKSLGAVADSTRAEKAKALLETADSDRSAGKIDEAKKKFKELIEQYPGTAQAASAKKALAEMGS
jgi:thiol-disulfide isomerase/thioredoxin